MIKNERQFRITKSQADKFSQALSQLVASPQSPQIHPLLRKAQEDALRSQLQELQAQLDEYEALRSGRQQVLEVESFADLPRALIQARIAAGLSQKQLADRLGLKEQQIQQYEATEYASASIARVQEIIRALGIHVREDIFLPSADVTKNRLYQRMQSIGVGRDLLMHMLPQPLVAKLQSEGPADGTTIDNAVLQAASIIGRVYDLRPATIFSAAPLRLDTTAVGNPRFKLPAQVNQVKTSAYTVYAHYLALLALEVTRSLETKPVSTDPHQVHETIVSTYGAMTFENALRYVWDLGIPVLPLADPATFHGACWRVEGRNIIVLKQRTRFPARWLHDLLHELHHAGEEPGEEERSVVETEDPLSGRHESEEEEEAQYFAEDTIFDGRADEIAEKVARRAARSTERLSTVVPQVAAEEKVPADALAYHVAYRLSEEQEDWWGGATNLQDKRTDPWKIARDIFLERADLRVINEIDRALLLQALTDAEE